MSVGPLRPSTALFLEKCLKALFVIYDWGGWGIPRYLKIPRGSLKKIVFYREIRFLAAITLTGPQIYWKQGFLLKGKFSLKIRYINVQYFNLTHAHKPKFNFFCFFFVCRPFRIFSLALFLPFSLPFFLVIFYSSYPFLSPVKSWELMMCKAWKWVLEQL